MADEEDQAGAADWDEDDDVDDPPARQGDFRLDRSGRTLIAKYRLSKELRSEARLRGHRRRETDRRLELIRFAPDGTFTITPKVTFVDSAKFGDPRYAVGKITLRGFEIAPPKDEGDVYAILQGLPVGFNRYPDFGLGLKKKYERILTTLAGSGIRELVIDKGLRWSVRGTTLTIPERTFDSVRRGIDRIHARALGAAGVDKVILIHNQLLSALNPSKYPEKLRPYAPDTVFRTIAAMAPVRQLSDQDQQAIVDLAASNARSLARREPGVLVELDRTLRSATLTQLIEDLRPLVFNNASEAVLQRFFSERPFALYMAFGVPVTMLGEQVSVGGIRRDGGGERKADFLLKAGLSGNLALVEIKTPGTPLLGSIYRTAGKVRGPSRQLAGAVAQIQDQRFILAADFRARFEGEDVGAPFAPHCLVIAGRSPKDRDEQKSFELYRTGLSGITIVTFDELLEKLRALARFLAE